MAERFSAGLVSLKKRKLRACVSVTFWPAPSVRNEVLCTRKAGTNTDSLRPEPLPGKSRAVHTKLHQTPVLNLGDVGSSTIHTTQANITGARTKNIDLLENPTTG